MSEAQEKIDSLEAERKATHEAAEEYCDCTPESGPDRGCPIHGERPFPEALRWCIEQDRNYKRHMDQAWLDERHRAEAAEAQLSRLMEAVERAMLAAERYQLDDRHRDGLVHVARSLHAMRDLCSPPSPTEADERDTVEHTEPLKKAK